MPKKRPKASLLDLDVNHVRARSIDLVDDKGKTKMRFSTSRETASGPAMTIIQVCGADGLPKLEMQVTDNSPGIRLTSETDHVGFSVSLNETSNGMMIGDKHGRPVIRIGIYHTDNGENPFGTKPAIVLSDLEDETESIDVAIKECKIIQPVRNRK
jgi:hypothetical protein